MLTFADRDVSLGDLEAVLAVYAYGHFTRASEMLGRPQPSVSHSVRHVESSVETILFDRSTRPVELTPQSERFLYELRKGLFFVQRAFAGLKTQARADGAVVEVGHSAYFDGELLTYLTHMSRTPNVGFSAVYHSSFTTETVANVLAGAWDCGFVLNPGNTWGLDATPIMRDPLGVVMSSNHPLTRKRVLHLRDIANAPLIAPARNRNPALRTWFLERCAAAGFAPTIAHEIGHPYEAAMLVEQCAGLALATQATAKRTQKGPITFRPFADQQLAIEIQLVMRPGRKPPALQAFAHAVERMKERIGRKVPAPDKLRLPKIA
jgi:DNA-binding transcriptional LysR family regulator